MLLGLFLPSFLLITNPGMIIILDAQECSSGVVGMVISTKRMGTRKNIHGLIGLAILIVAQLLLLKKVEPLASWFYYFAWWPYILIADSIIYRIKGNSLLMDRRGEFMVMSLCSVVIWTFFEAVNLVMQNWYYVNVIPLVQVRWPGYFIAYATVLPGLFETTELLESLGLFKNSRVTPRVLSIGAHLFLFILGSLCLASVFFFPAYCFGLIWCALTFLLEPINYYGGVKSILRDWERGTLRKLYLLLTAGLVCGMLWEFWNFWATTKWIYTVPFFEELKLFEMPLLGFLGFPPFAVQCYVMYNFISLFRYHRCWEDDSYGLNRNKKVHFALIATAITAGTLCCLSTFSAMDTTTVNSSWSTLRDLPGIPPAAVHRMSALGIRSPQALLSRASLDYERDELALLLSVPAGDMALWLKAAELSELKGMGAGNASMLIKGGIHDVLSLANQQAEELHQRLSVLHRGSPGTHAPPPRVPVMRVWIREAKKRTGHPG